MDPATLGKKYDKIASWWQDRHDQGDYGIHQLQRALGLCDSAPTTDTPNSSNKQALDVGCGAGGRFVRILATQNFEVTGIDVSAEMIKLATANHPESTFINHNICTWETSHTFDLILAWDSLFHLPLHEHETVVSKLCSMLNEGGVLLYTFGDAIGEHEDQWLGDSFYYSSIGITGNLRLLMNNGLVVQHMELDQYPEPHVYVIAKNSSSSN